MEGLLLVGHGTRSAAGRRELLSLGELVAAAVPDVAVETGFLELCDPPAGIALDRLVTRGARRIAVVPLVLAAAGHAKCDVPAVVLDARARHARVMLCYGRPLGVDHAVLSLARQRVEAVQGRGLPLLVLARGASEPDANADACKMARLLAEQTGAPLVLTGFSGLTWPLVPDALDQCRRLGADRLVTFAWFLCTGVLVERIRADCAAFAGRSGVQVLHAGYLGPDPQLVPTVLERYGEALRGEVRMNCDVCTYRRPFPGFEHHVGQPLGVGHSHLATAHRGQASSGAPQ